MSESSPAAAADRSSGARGQLRIYLGAAPGVGKTYAMLGEGQRRRERGTDVVIGYVEFHDRAHTAAMAEGLETVPRRTVDHRGVVLSEMDVDAIIRRRPAVALVDELAHTNAPGSPNRKRWEDIEDLLAEGIDVISTVNIQHLESINDVVEAITGVKQRETVPDAVVRGADQIELVDMSPEALRRRMAHGNIYAPDKVDAAMGNYFRIGNLTALRELALLWVADRVEEGLENYRHEHGIDQTWASKQRIVVALTGGPESATLLRRAAVITGRSAGRELLALHVIRGDGTAGPARPERLARLRQLTADLSGSFHVVVDESVSHAVLSFARSVNATQVVVGASRRSRLRQLFGPSHVEQIVRGSGEIDVHVVTHERAGQGAPLPKRRVGDLRRRLAWVAAVLIPVAVTMVLMPLRGHLSLSSIMLTFLLGVVASSLIGGILPALLTAVLAALAANYFFTPPVGTLTISDPENAFALLVLVAVGVVVAAVVDRSAARLETASRSRAEANVLATLSTQVLTRQDGVKGLLEQACETFRMRGATLFESTGPDRRPSIAVVEVYGADAPAALADADVVADAGPGLTLALRGRPLRAGDRRLLDAFAIQSAGVLERNRLAARAADAQRLAQVDASRTALLQAVSHDLRTPLASIRASLETLANEDLPLTEADRDHLTTDALDSCERLQAMVLNLLDLSRLQAGAVHPQFDEVHLDALIREVAAGYPEDLWQWDISPGLPSLVTDAALLERVLANLLGNAIRFSSPGRPVRISASVLPGGIIELRIVDRGPGVPAKQKERMFDAFQRLDDSSPGGVGLGLAVARGLAETLSATLEAEDTPGGGLTMTVTLPLAGPARKEAP
ncbi:MAG: DUF4118 domain-containing protein [Candidatus Nanopelagicales bacterium]